MADWFERFMRSWNKVTWKQQVTDDHKPTDNELNNICYLSMKYMCGFEMRQCDYSVIKSMAGKISTLEQVENTFCVVLGEYVWDHLMGKPDDPTSEQAVKACKKIKDYLYSLGEDTREDIGGE